jgi:hypothetical protein
MGYFRPAGAIRASLGRWLSTRNHDFMEIVIFMEAKSSVSFV